MSRKKDNTVLFEVLSKGHSSMRVPDYVYKSRQRELDKQKAEADKAQADKAQAEEALAQEQPPEPETEAPDEAVVEADAPTPVVDDTPLLTEAWSVDATPDADAEESSDAEAPPVIPPMQPKKPISSGQGQVRSTLPSWARPRDEAQQKAGTYITPTVRRRFVEVHGDRLHLSVNVVAAMLLLGAILVLWVGAFVAGRMTAPGPETPEANPNPAAPVNPGSGPSVALAKLDIPSEAIRGGYDSNRYYLRIQRVLGTTEEARAAARKVANKIVAYCEGMSIPAEAFNASDGVWVVSRMGFRSPTSKEARSYAKKVHAAGKVYQQRTRGSYAFSQETEGRPSPAYISGKRISQPK